MIPPCVRETKKNEFPSQTGTDFRTRSFYTENMSRHDTERHRKVILACPPRLKWFPGTVHCQGRHDQDDSYADEIVARYWRPVLTIVAVGLSLRWLGKRLTGTRYETAAHIPPDVYSKQTWIRGRVTSVGDSDNFRLYHTPGFGWGWLRKVPTTRKGLHPLAS